jgi:PAS domain S-box-containing protein
MITDSTSIFYFSNPLVLTNIFGTIITGLGGLGTCIIAWKSILKPLWLKHLKKQKEQDSVLINQSKFFVNIEEMTEKILEISKELKPNGGGSIKDQVKQIATDVKTICVERDATFLLSKEPMFKSDEHGYCILANNALCQLYGVSQEQLLGLGWLNYIIEEDKERIKEEWVNVIETGTEIASYYTIINQITNEEVPVKYRAIINKHNGKIISAIGNVEKTAMKKTLHKLKTV